MSLYVDSSALLKRYIEEPDSEVCERYLLADTTWLTARHTFVEVRRNLARLLPPPSLGEVQHLFLSDWERINVVELDEITCNIAADIAEQTGARTLDALHLAAASRLGADALEFLTFDIKQAHAARMLKFRVLGA